MDSVTSAFTELLLDQLRILFFYSNQLLPIYSDFRCNHNLTNILWYSLDLCHIFYIRISGLVTEGFSIDDNIIIADSAFG